MFGRDDGGPWGPRPAFAWSAGPGAGEIEGEMWGRPWGRGRHHARWGHSGPWDRGPWGRGPWGGPPPFSHGFGPGFGPPPMLWHMARRFGFGPGGPGFGPGGPGFGPGPRMFGRGDLKYALLDLLQERPKHGYEMIKELESRAGGFYTPSAGAVYPTLQLLEDRGWVSAQSQEGKKVYTITDDGRQALQEHQQREQERMGRGPRGPWEWGEHGHGQHRGRYPFGGIARSEMRALAHEGREVAHLMRSAVIASAGNPERLTQLRGIVERAKGELHTFLAQSQQPQQSPAPDQSGGSSGPVEQV